MHSEGHDMGRATLVLVAFLLVAPAYAGERCASSCRVEVAACRRAECATARGTARRDCIERCRGRSGCPARIHTLAYVVSRCRATDGRLVGGQELRVRRGDCDATTVLRFDSPGEVEDGFGLCGILARNREGFGSGLAGVLQRLGVTPDGSGVVFEVTNAFQRIGRTPLTTEQQGFFYVRSDGGGLRRLGPPSRDPTYRIGITPTGALTASFHTFLSFDRHGSRVVFTDIGPAPDGSDAAQIITLDLETGQRTRVSHFPAITPRPSDSRAIESVFFLDDETLQFRTQV